MVNHLAQYIGHEEVRESFKQEAIDSWREYRETGLHLTGNEVKNWLRGWGTEADFKQEMMTIAEQLKQVGQRGSQPWGDIPP